MPDRNELRRLLLFAAAVLVLTFIGRVYAPALSAALVWDDHMLVEANAAYRHASFGQIMTGSFWPDSPLGDARVPYFRPLVLLTFLGDMQLGGSPAEFHITNLFLHLATCAFLGITAVRAGASYPSALVAMLGWGVFPRLTEAVVWVAGRTDVLAAFFGFAALCVWPEVAPSSRRALWARSLLGGVFLFCACASKEVGLAFAVAMGAATALRPGTRATLVRAGVSIGLPIIVYFALRAAAIAESPELRPLGFGRRAGTVLEAIGRYGEMVLDPFHSQTSIGVLGEIDGVRVVAGVVVVALSVGVAYRLVDRGAFGPRVGSLLALVAIAPVLHVVPIALAGSVTADRLLYVPLAGAAVALACTLSSAPRWLGGLAIATAGLFAVYTHSRVTDYREETRFWTIAAEHAPPHNTMPRRALATWLMPVETEPACKLYERAGVVLDATDRAGTPAHQRTRENLAACWTRAGRYDEAVALLEELAQRYPSSARIRLALGLAHLHRRDFERAAAAFARAVELEPKSARVAVRPDLLARLARTDARFGSLSAVHQAEHLAALGRAPEASAAYIALAADEKLSLDDRRDAVQYLMVEGPVPAAERALEIVPSPPEGWDTNNLVRFARRRSIHRAFLELRPRIEALQ